MSVQCPGSDTVVDPRPPRQVTAAACPSCGRIVPLGGTPFDPRYAIHNEPTLTETVADTMGMSLGDLIQHVFGEERHA